MKHLLTVIALTCCTAQMAAAALPIQPLQDIEAAVRALVDSHGNQSGDVEASVGRLDPRLRLPLCRQPLAARYTQTRRRSGTLSVEVRCEGQRPWSLYVPVTLARFAEVVIATRPLARGQSIAAEDVTLARRRVDISTRTYFEQPATAIGRLATRSIASGEILDQHQLRQPRLVRRGEQVVLSLGNSAVKVSMKGEALADGAAGERIRVRNLSSARIVEGTVTAAGVVVVNGGSVL